MKVILKFIFIAIVTISVNAKTYDDNKTIKCINGKCSWYGKKFDGRKTASGERFDSTKNSAAHKSLPFGTKLKVTDTKSGKSTIVTVNDRGPFCKSRVLDISSSAAEELGIKNRGVFNANIEILN